jgi:tRNA A58 N-methylase Trm61
MLNVLESDPKTTCINLKIEELFMREAQVLPLRTHPHMNMHGKSGYILSGIKLA